MHTCCKKGGCHILHIIGGIILNRAQVLDGSGWHILHIAGGLVHSCAQVSGDIKLAHLAHRRWGLSQSCTGVRRRQVLTFCTSQLGFITILHRCLEKPGWHILHIAGGAYPARAQVFSEIRLAHPAPRRRVNPQTCQGVRNERGWHILHVTVGLVTIAHTCLKTSGWRILHIARGVDHNPAHVSGEIRLAHLHIACGVDHSCADVLGGVTWHVQTNRTWKVDTLSTLLL